MNAQKLNPAQIAELCSARHIQSVLEDLIGENNVLRSGIAGIVANEKFLGDQLATLKGCLQTESGLREQQEKHSDGLLDELKLLRAELKQSDASNNALLEENLKLREELDVMKADRRVLQERGEHDAPCARFCESNAYEIAERHYKAEIAKLLGANKDLQNWFDAAKAELDAFKAENIALRKVWVERCEELDALNSQKPIAKKGDLYGSIASDMSYNEMQKPRYFRRQREAREVTQWTGDNISEIAAITHMAASVTSGWVYLRCMLSGALMNTVPPNGWVFYGEDGRLRVEDDEKFKSKYEVR